MAISLNESETGDKGEVFRDVHMKGMQDTLGLMNDAAVMCHMMDDLIPEDADADLRQYAQVLVDWRADQYKAKEDRLNDQWTEFLDAERPWEEWAW